MKIKLERRTTFFVVCSIFLLVAFYLSTISDFDDLIFHASIIFAVGLFSPKSMSQQMEIYINELLDKGVDLTNKSDKRIAWIKYLDPRKIDRKKGLDLLNKLLKKVLKKRGFVVSDFVRPRLRRQKTGLDATITPRPQRPALLPDSIEAEVNTDTATTGEKTEDAKLVKKKIKKLVYDKDGKPIGEAEVEVFTSVDSRRVYHDWEHFDEEGVSASINAFYIIIRVSYPELESLSPEEKKSLGKMWLPAFKRYLSENWAYVGVPFLATMGLMLPKIATARREHKKSLGDSSETKKDKPEKKPDKFTSRSGRVWDDETKSWKKK